MAKRMRARVRAVTGNDRKKLSTFLHRLSPATVRTRYLSDVQFSGAVLEGEVARLVDSAADRHTVVVAVADCEIRGVAEYVADSDASAEVAIVVEDAFQGRGIGGALFRRLVG